MGGTPGATVTFRRRYTEDGSVASLEDAVYIDDIVFVR